MEKELSGTGTSLENYGSCNRFGGRDLLSPHINNLMVIILRKEGWGLNPNDKVVNGVLKMVEKNNGVCPCHNTGVDKNCPCSDYRENDVCHCGLYVKLT